MTVEAPDETYIKSVAAMIRRRQAAAWWLGGPAGTGWRDSDVEPAPARRRRPVEPFAYLDTTGTWRDHTGQALVSELDVELGVGREDTGDGDGLESVTDEVPLIERQWAAEQSEQGHAA